MVAWGKVGISQRDNLYFMKNNAAVWLQNIYAKVKIFMQSTSQQFDYKN